MQVKVVIGTAAFMLTMIILGYAALREPSRLEDMAGAFTGRSVETGGIIFDNQCANCHGVEGKAQDCGVDSAGEAIACQGLPLNNYFLLCGEPPQRLTDMSFEGTAENYIAKTVTSGRGAMPTWSNRFGGPMRDDQIQNVTWFVLNWAEGGLCDEPPVTFPWPETGVGAAAAYHELVVEDPPYETQAGDPEVGAELYVSLGCAGCHGQPETPGSASLGPWLGEIAENGADRIDGMSAQDYIYESVLDPRAFVAPDCPNGPCASPSAMRADYASTLAENPQDLADILAYLMGDSYEYP